MNNYYYFLSLGICPICTRNKLYGDERRCLDCKEKSALYYNTIKRDVKRYKERLEKKLEQDKITRAERKEKGICIECGRRKARYNRVRCEICLEKNATKARLIRYSKEEALKEGS